MYLNNFHRDWEELLVLNNPVVVVVRLGHYLHYVFLFQPYVCAEQSQNL